MKKLTWMELAVAMPMALTFASLGGLVTVVSVTGVMVLAMALVKWGKSVSFKRKEVRMEAVRVTSSR